MAATRTALGLAACGTPKEVGGGFNDKGLALPVATVGEFGG